MREGEGDIGIFRGGGKKCATVNRKGVWGRGTRIAQASKKKRR